MAFGDDDTAESVDDTAIENELFRVDLESVVQSGLSVTVSAYVGWADTGGYPFCEVAVYALDGTDDLLMGRRVFTTKTLADPDSSDFVMTFTF